MLEEDEEENDEADLEPLEDHPTEPAVDGAQANDASGPKLKGESDHAPTLKMEPEKMVPDEGQLRQAPMRLEAEIPQIDAPPPVDNTRRPTLEFQKKLEAIFNDGTETRAEQRQRINRPRIQFYNTFQLEPNKKFSRNAVEHCIGKTLTESLEGKKYFSITASALTAAVAEIIRNRVLEFGYDRYKIIVLVSIGPMARQGIEIGTKCLWDPSRDHYAYGTFQSYHIFASACVYGIYFD